MAKTTQLWRIFPDDFLAFAGRGFPISASISAWLSLSHGREIIDALLSDRRRPRLFTDHGVDRLGAGYRLNAAMRQPPRWVERTLIRATERTAPGRVAACRYE